MKKSDREKVFGKFGGKCAYCGCELAKSWHVDHFVPIVRNHKYDYSKKKWVYDGTCHNPEAECMENYFPSCPSCNHNKRSMSIEGFRKLIQGFITSLNRDSTQYKIAKRYGLIQEQIKPIKFYFETIEQ